MNGCRAGGDGGRHHLAAAPGVGEGQGWGCEGGEEPGGPAEARPCLARALLALVTRQPAGHSADVFCSGPDLLSGDSSLQGAAALPLTCPPSHVLVVHKLQGVQLGARGVGLRGGCQG